MPSSGPSSRSNRKGHYSCAFCRSRKLRCDRPLPCTNCVSRGKSCHFGTDAGQHVRTPTARVPSSGNTTTQSLPHQQVASGSSFPPLPSPQPSPHSAPPHQEDLLTEIRALKKIAQDLEKRVTKGASHPGDSGTGNVSLLASTASPDGLRTDVGLTPSSEIGEVSEVVAYLEHVSMGRSPKKPSHIDDPVLKIEPLHTIPDASNYTTHQGKIVRCVCLPQLGEAKLLVDAFVSNLSYIYHVVHHPSLPGFVDNIYHRVASEEPIKPGSIVLLLSIIASATLVWVQPDGIEGENRLFLSSADATAQTPLWVKAAQDMLNGGQTGPPVELETVQGIIILSFLVCNLEGVSLRYRLLISTGLLLSRELGLDRIDRGPNTPGANNVEAEMGRRAWWYLVATDWLMAAIYGGPGEGVYQVKPRQMTVNKPRNINDVDLLVHGPDKPLSQPTEMSYFLQRIRLAELSSSIADHTCMALEGSARSSYYAHIMAMDVELDQMIHDVPSFFNLDTYDPFPQADRSATFVQAYLLNSIIHTQRCKLHLGYLTSKPSKTSPAYAASWETCLKAARQINRAERQLESARHPFCLIRQRLSGILYGVFMSSVVLLMDACVNGDGLDRGESRRHEAAEALRVVEDSRGFSSIAASLYDWLTQVLAKHGAGAQQLLEQGPAIRPPGQASPAAASSTGTMTEPVGQDSGPLAPAAATAAQTITDGQSSPWGTLPLVDCQPSVSSQLVQGLEELMDVDGFQWEDLISGIGSSSFL